MDRDDAEALERRIFGTVKDEDADVTSNSTEANSGTATAREGVTRAISDEELQLLREKAAAAEDDGDTRAEADIAGFDVDPKLEGPGDLPHSMDVADVAPDGTSIGRGGLTDPLGQTIGGGGQSDSIESGAGQLGGGVGGSRLDPLGLTDLGGGAGVPGVGNSDRALDRIIGARDGSMVSAVPRDPATGMDAGRDRDLDPPAPPTGRHEDPSWDGPVDPVNPTGRQDDPDYDGSDEHAPPMEGRSQDPTDPDQGDDIVGGGYAQPDPTGDFDVITGESIAAAIKTNDPGVNVQPSQDGDSAGTAAAVGRAAAVNDPQQITNFGPEGEQNVEVGANWAPPTDGIFDPPPESASALGGSASAMAEPGAATAGSVIGSTGEPEFPAPSDPPPGEDGPGGPPGGGGDEG